MVRIAFPEQPRLDNTAPLKVVHDLDGEAALLDLRGCTFIKPFGTTYLYWITEGLATRGASEVRVRLPERRDVRAYMLRCDVLASLRSLERVVVEPEFDEDPDDARVAFPRELLEFQTVDLPNDDVVNDVAEKLLILLTESDPVFQDHYDDLATVVAEVLSNIQVHSRTQRGSIVAQRFSDHVCFAFGDGGVGIPGALASRLPDAAEHERIQEALEPHVTSRPDRGGMGLTELSDVVDRYAGAEMAIRSGRGRLRRTAGTATSASAEAFPGTLVEVCLPISGE